MPTRPHPRQPAVCAQCGVDFMALVASVRAGMGRFCSSRCSGDHNRETARFVGAGNPRWLGGVSADNMRYRRRQKERWPEKEAARRKVRYAVQWGHLTPKPCERCGADEAQAHHHDYSKPLDVEWLCRPCHTETHVAERAGAAR